MQEQVRIYRNIGNYALQISNLTEHIIWLEKNQSENKEVVEEIKSQIENLKRKIKALNTALLPIYESEEILPNTSEEVLPNTSEKSED